MAIQFKNLVDVFEQRTGAIATDAYTLTVSTEQTSGATPNPGTGGLKVQYYSVSSGTTHGFGLVAGSSSSDFLTSGPMHFYTNSDLDTKNATGLAMILDTSQNLGIGVTSITAGNRLEVAGGTIGIDDYLVHNGDTTTKFGFVANNNFVINTAGVERVRVTSGGSVGIATNNPGAKLDVEGNAVIGAAGNTVSGDFAVAINKNTVVTSEDGFAQGENTIATGRQAAAFGFNTYANGPASIAGGSLSETNAQRSIAVGATAITNAEDSAAFNTGTRANGLFSFATGQGCFATNNAAFATGSNTQATGLYSFSGGVNSIASGNGAVALGGGAQCSGEFSFAAGNINVASGVNSTALGFDNDAIGAHSTVIGHLNTTSAAAAYGVAINFQNTVSGQGAFAFNQGNTVSGLNAASGGVSNTVDAEGSFAYGFGNDTSGAGATPPQQILLGRFLKPPRDVAGNAGEAQVIVGRHNEHANQSATAFAVGTGTAANATRSSLKVYYDDTVSLANNVTVRSTNSYFSNPIRIGADDVANELDDYEEGTYTPGVFGYFGGLTMISYTTRLGKYVKIGRIVHCFFEIVFTASVGSNNIVGLNGLPFVPSDDGGAYGAGSIGVAYKNRWNFVYTSAGGADSLLGIRKLGTINTVFFNMDDGSGTNSMRVDALTGDTSNSMSMVAHITYRTTS